MGRNSDAEKMDRRGDGAAHASGAGAGGKATRSPACSARVEELEAENAELRQLLSQEESGRLLAARFNGRRRHRQRGQGRSTTIRPTTTNSWAWTRTTTRTRSKTRCSATSPRMPSSPSKRRSWASTPPAPRKRRRSISAPRPAWMKWSTITWPISPDPDKSDEENRAAVLEFLAGRGHHAGEPHREHDRAGLARPASSRR